jgi:flagellar protein FlaJ
MATAGATRKATGAALVRRGARVPEPRSSRSTPAGAPEPEARPVRVKRGRQPSHSPLKPFERWAWTTFGERANRRPPDLALEENLLKSHMRIRAEEYRAVVYAATVVAGAALLALGVALGVVLALTVSPLAGIGVGVGTPFLALPVYMLLGMRPQMKANSRGKAIDHKISVAMNFMSAMASADVTVDQIFRELARQKIYGEIAEEAAWITRDTELLGIDILSAIKIGATRSPSKRWQDFLQGVVTTATSGGQLKPYFLTKADQYEKEAKLDLLSRTETMGLMAEVFVIGVVAFPLFLIIILAIFVVIGGSGGSVLILLWAIVGIVIPAIEGSFIFIMKVLASEM